MNQYCIRNGNILNESSASVSVNNRSFRYGDGCFETMKYIDGHLLLAGLHFDRLFSSLQTLQFECPSFFTPQYLELQVHELVKKNAHQKLARIRITVFRGDGGLYDTGSLTTNWLIQSWALSEETNNLNTNGLMVGIYNEGYKAADKLANIKSNNYLLYAMAALYAKKKKWNDALVLNHHATIADATIANLFIIQNNIVITPPLTDGPVAGVMRRYLLEKLPLNGYVTEEKTISPDDLERAEEAFLTNSIFGLKWIQMTGDNRLAMHQCAAIHREIITPVYKV